MKPEENTLSNRRSQRSFRLPMTGTVVERLLRKYRAKYFFDLCPISLYKLKIVLQALLLQT